MILSSSILVVPGAFYSFLLFARWIPQPLSLLGILVVFYSSLPSLATPHLQVMFLLAWYRMRVTISQNNSRNWPGTMAMNIPGPMMFDMSVNAARVSRLSPMLDHLNCNTGNSMMALSPKLPQYSYLLVKQTWMRVRRNVNGNAVSI